jgi:hypothetical protein
VSKLYTINHIKDISIVRDSKMYNASIYHVDDGLHYYYLMWKPSAKLISYTSCDENGVAEEWTETIKTYNSVAEQLQSIGWTIKTKDSRVINLAVVRCVR